MRQKLLASLLSVCLLFSLLPASALAANLDDGLTPITDENEDATTPENTNQDETSTDPENQENPETSSDNAGENVDITENITSEKTNVEPVNDVAPLADVATVMPEVKEGTITLTQDVTLASTYTFSGETKNITLNLAGHTITVNGNAPGIVVPYGYTVTIKDENGAEGKEGTIQRGDNYTNYVVQNNGELILNGGTIKLTNERTSTALANRSSSAGQAEMVINGGKVIADYIAIKNDCSDGTVAPQLTINGGLVATGHDQAVQNWGIATINGGEFSGCVATWTGGTEHGNTTIHGGTFNLNGSTITPSAVVCVFMATKDYPNGTDFSATLKIEMKDGIDPVEVSSTGRTENIPAVAVAQQTSTLNEIVEEIPEDINVSITQGTYSSDVSAFVPATHTCTPNAAEAKWTVKEATGLVGDSEVDKDTGTTTVTITGSASSGNSATGDGLEGTTKDVIVDASATGSNATANAEVKIPAETAATMENTNSIKVEANGVTVTLPSQSVDQIAEAGKTVNGQAGSEVTIIVKQETPTTTGVAAKYSIGVTAASSESAEGEALLPPGGKNGTITIQVPIPAGVTSDANCFVYYVVGTTRKQLMKSSVANGLITITTDHLSTYEILTTKDTTIAEATYIDATDDQQKTGTLEQAIAAAKTGSTITLNKDVELSAPITIEGKDVTIEGIDNTITPADNFTGDSLIEIKKDSTNEATVTLDGVTVDASGNDKVTAVKCDEGANLTVDGGDISDVFVEPGANVTTTQDDTIGKVQIALDDPSNTDRVVVEIENPKATDESAPITGGAIPAGETATVIEGNTITSDVTIGEGATLDIPEGTTITVKPDSTGATPTITNNGNLKVEGKLEAVDASGNPGDLTVSGNGQISVSGDGEVSLPASQFVTITLKYDDDGITPDGTIKVKTNTSATLPKPDRIGYTFAGWAIEGTGDTVISGTTTFSNDVTLVAQWTSSVPVTGVSLDRSSHSLNRGYSFKLTATVSPSNAVNKAVKWNSSNPDVAEVSNDGTVTAKGPGTATITATAMDGSGKYATCTVTVTVPVSGISITSSRNLYVNETYKLAVTFTPTDATNRTLYWTSSDTSIARVDGDGVVTGVNPGSATITVTSADGSYRAYCTVTVLEGYYPTYVGGGSTTVRRPSTSTPSASPAPSESPAPSTTPSTTSKPTVTFTDVAKDAWYYDAVAWAVENKITTGINATTFAPNAECTRAQIVAFLYRYAGEPEVEAADNPFTDVAENSWYYKAVQWAVANGITTGVTADTFYPEAEVTRAQTFTFLYRFIKGQVSSGAENPFTDVNTDTWYTDAVLWAAENGITTGVTATTFAPESVCERCQIVTILYRVDQKQE